MEMKQQYDFDHTTGEGQKQLMYMSRGLDVRTKYVNLLKDGDYGADPIGDGMFRMIPSGDIVDYNERCKRLERR